VNENITFGKNGSPKASKPESVNSVIQNSTSGI